MARGQVETAAVREASEREAKELQEFTLLVQAKTKGLQLGQDSEVVARLIELKTILMTTAGNTRDIPVMQEFQSMGEKSLDEMVAFLQDEGFRRNVNSGNDKLRNDLLGAYVGTLQGMISVAKSPESFSQENYLTLRNNAEKLGAWKWPSLSTVAMYVSAAVVVATVVLLCVYCPPVGAAAALAVAHAGGLVPAVAAMKGVAVGVGALAAQNTAWAVVAGATATALGAGSAAYMGRQSAHASGFAEGLKDEAINERRAGATVTGGAYESGHSAGKREADLSNKTSVQSKLKDQMTTLKETYEEKKSMAEAEVESIKSTTGFKSR